MSEHVLNFHLGDNASFSFEGALYIGLTASLPIRVTNVAAPPAPVQLIVRTSSVETLAPTQAHTVSLDGFEIGLISDTGTGNSEVHTIAVPRTLLRPGQAQRLTIQVVGRLPTLEDDFVLRSIELIGADLHLGWV